MKTTPWIKLCKGAALALAVSYGLTYCHTTKSKLTLEQKGDSLTVIHITYPANYILLPIEEEAMESQVLLDTGEATDTDMDIRLAQTKVELSYKPQGVVVGVVKGEEDLLAEINRMIAEVTEQKLYVQWLDAATLKAVKLETDSID